MIKFNDRKVPAVLHQEPIILFKIVARIRARLNFEDQVNDKVKVVVGIATDGGTARSNNYTLGGSISQVYDGITNAG